MPECYLYMSTIDRIPPFTQNSELEELDQGNEILKYTHVLGRFYTDHFQALYNSVVTMQLSTYMVGNCFTRLRINGLRMPL